MRLLYPIVLLATGAGCSGTPPANPIHVISYGVYEPGSAWPRIVLQTDVVPAVVGTRFCVKMWHTVGPVIGKKPVYSYYWRIPRFADEATERTEVIQLPEQSFTFGTDRRFAVCWEFADQAGLAPGRYTLTVSRGPDVVLEQSFEVVVVLLDKDN